MTPEQAVAHPNWSMGAKISVDSATMMNKGLELIEAHHLFGLPRSGSTSSSIPQSVIHSLVEYVDGSVLAQLGSPDMRIPIAHALAWPERMATPAERLDLAAIGTLDFEAPDLERFPALRLAREALERAARRRSSSMPPTRWRSPPSSTGGSVSSISPTVERGAGGRRPAPRSIAEVIDIDRGARIGAKALMSEMAA